MRTPSSGRYAPLPSSGSNARSPSSAASRIWNRLLGRCLRRLYRHPAPRETHHLSQPQHLPPRRPPVAPSSHRPRPPSSLRPPFNRVPNRGSYRLPLLRDSPSTLPPYLPHPIQSRPSRPRPSRQLPLLLPLPLRPCPLQRLSRSLRHSPLNSPHPPSHLPLPLPRPRPRQQVDRDPLAHSFFPPFAE